VAGREEVLWGLWYARGQRWIDEVLTYLVLHPDDRGIRGRLVKDCELGGPLNGTDPMAYEVLRRFDVLRGGMTLGEAVKVLGPTAEQDKDGAKWYWYPPSRPSVALRPSRTAILGKLKDGKIEGWSRNVQDL
jgi:hypothetical protein